MLYPYGTGQPSSRKIDPATYDAVPYRVLAAVRQQHLLRDPEAISLREDHRATHRGWPLLELRICHHAVGRTPRPELRSGVNGKVREAIQQSIGFWWGLMAA